MDKLTVNDICLCDELNEVVFDSVVDIDMDNDTIILIGTVEQYKDLKNYLLIAKLSSDEDILGWCRIDTNNLKYITGYNENMTLNNSEKEKITESLRTGNLDFHPSYNKTVEVKNATRWDFVLDTFDIYQKSIDGTMPYLKNKENYQIPDLTKIKED